MVRLIPLFPALLAAAVAGCTALPASHAPDYTQYEGFHRETAVAIALREWHLFGSPVHDEPPGSRLPLTAEETPSRQEGLWQRVGDYWWVGQDVGTTASLWTGRTDENGNEFPIESEDRYAWSAAFISYIMRASGAGEHFPYAPAHATYVNAARRKASDVDSGWIVVAERPEEYAPRLGDLICTGRDSAAGISFDDLPARFPGHCDIVVEIRPGRLAVIGGNVRAAVSMKHVPITADGKLAAPDGAILDDRYPWFVVLRVLYAAPPTS